MVSNADGRFVVAEHAQAAEDGTKKWTIWNAQTRRSAGGFKAKVLGLPLYASEHLVVNCTNDEGDYLEVRELPSGRLLVSMPVGALFSLSVSPDNHFLALVFREDRELQMFELPSLKPLWRKGCSRLFAF